MTISLDEAFEGKTTQIKVPRLGPVRSGAAGHQPDDLRRGRGRVRTQNGIFAMERGCPTCQGRGR